MKKVMFMIVGMLFSMSVSAATLTLVAPTTMDEYTYGAGPSASEVTGSATTYLSGLNDFSHDWGVTGDSNAVFKVDFLPSDNPVQIGTVELFLASNLMNSLISAGPANINTFSYVLLESVKYVLRISGTELDNTVSYHVNVNAVPIPAALFLFAPALLGFFGLRRKAAVAA